ncbi:nicotinate-nucleotide--dimethylbenzimidazole phosphoribosyltransferase [Streptomyces sp. DT2A-34]|uniref:nicotinate-nucleotide--dimethylbenzimidazole phosphoribosyltransferase n=1 Tax=Streptomyces sp. DT2A-34 TaxID=3051182 RepID=UPI00265C7503|nr:nicotinate-nucleotide--dimethylbenzimidazole phosphoribosyltransferase [Streptomyces sp. DT2A-34]MDO0916318.1 nicotinate-nucleotide--dimethylbenzimidazole phosphoribosyltransferase [Streptomyces sp. DT2A-34]
MTDTGQVPGEGLPESAGMVEQPGVPAAHGTYTYLSETTAQDEDLLLPGSQGAWGNEVAPPAPEPVVEAVHEPDAHQISGRDSGSVDLSGVRLPGPTAPSTPIPPITPRRPLHLGPPIPDASASPVRSLADRGAVGAPTRQPGPAPTGPEYLDAPQYHEAQVPQPATPWGAPAQAAVQTAVQAQAPAPAPFGVEVPAAETVVPTGQPGGEPVGVAQAAVARVATEAGATTGAAHEVTNAAQGAEVGVPVPQESVYGGQEPPGGAAAPVAGAVPGQDSGPMPAAAQEPGVGETAGVAAAPGADEALGVAAAPGADEALGVAAAPGADEALGVAAAPGADEALGVAAAPGADEALGVAAASGADEAAGAVPAAEAEQIAAAVPAAEAGEAAPGADDAGAGEAAVAAGEDGTAAGEVPASEADSGAAQVPDGAGAPDAAQTGGVGDAPEGGQGAEPGQAPEDLVAAVPAEAAEAVVGGAAPVTEVPAAEPGPVAAETAPETAQVSEAVDADAGQVDVALDAAVEQVVEGAAPELEQAPEGAAPELEQAPEGAAPELEQAPEGAAPEPAQVPEVLDPETAQVADASAPEAVQVLDAAAPETPAQVSEPPAAEPPAAEAASAEPAAESPEAQAPEAAPVPPVPDAAQAPQPADAEHIAPDSQPAEAVAAATDGASAVVAPEPTPQAADVEQVAAEQESEPSAPVAQPAEASDPQQTQAPEAVQDPHHAQAPQPTQDGTPTDVNAEAQAVAASAPAPDAEAQAEAVSSTDPHAEPPVADPAAQMPDAQPTPDVSAEPAEAAQPLAPDTSSDTAPTDAAAPDSTDPQPTPSADTAPAEAPQPFVAEPAGPQLQPLAAQSADGSEEPVTRLEPTPDQSLGQFVPVEGSVPTTPHLAPTPPQPTVLPTDEAPAPVATVPAPREGDPELVQHAEDLDTRAADQEDQEAPAEESTAVEEVRQSTGPAAPAYDDAEREAVLKVMRERRDIRNGFRSDPIPHEVLLRVLEAAHTAPSVGHSQPWDFVVIRSAETRRTMHELAMRQREAYAKSLPKGRAKQFKELKIEAILDTPVNIVVTADPTRGGRHTLGRHTQPQMAPYSAALAVENLWLAARAEGLGVGWVSFFDEREMVRALGLPEHLEVIAYLCVGYVDEFPDEPELMQAGWSKRRPLSWVVHEETYGRRALPGEEPHDLLAETVAQIRPLDAKALGEAWERQKRMTKPAGALGMLEIISAQLSGLSRQCPPPIPEPAAVAIFAGDHGVHAQGVTPWPQEVTAQMVANFLGGGAVCNAFAGQVGAEVCVVDVGVAADLPATPGLLPRKVRAGTSDMTTGPAMTREEAKQAIEVGIETARDLVAAGNKALLTGEMGIANTTASAALISVFTDTDPAEVTGRGTGINDETLARKTEVVRRAVELHQPDPADPIGVLAAIGGFEHAALVGLLLGGASLRTPVILDGVSAGAAALVARAIAPEVLAACIAGHRSAEPGHVAALNKLGLRPLVDLDLRLGEGTGALLALPLVQSTARAMHEVATFDSAGVTEK